MKPLSLILATAGLLLHPLAEARVAAKAQPSKEKTANHAELALACYYGWGQPQDFHEARKQARLAGGTAGLVVEALCLGRGRGAEQDLGRAWKLLAPLLLKGEPMAQAAAAVIMGDGLATDEAIPAVIAAEFREEIAATPSYDPALRTERARLALTGLRPRLEGDAVACVIAGQLYAWGVGIAKDEARAEELFRRAAALGCSDAMNQLGNLFNEGEPVRRDKAEALRWFQAGAAAGNSVAKVNVAQFDATLAPEAFLALLTAAANAGNADAMLHLGTERWLGARLTPDLSAAREWLEKAAACGRREAQAQLGKLLRDSPRNEDERHRGTALLRRAVLRGSALAANYLCLAYVKGEPELPANPRVGYFLARMAAESGEKDAWATLALTYQDGLGVAKDLKAARKCLETGAELGSAAAAYNLGCFLTNGEDGPPDPKLAFRHFLAAAEQGTVPGAMGVVGWRLMLGKGVEKDEKAAVAWLRKAVAQGDAAAMDTLGVACERGVGGPADAGEALKLYRAAAESGNPPGMLHLAMFLQLGKAGPADPEGGFRWLRKAADLETKEAFIFLSRAYENGTGTGVDPAEAWRWLMKAAEAGDADGCYWLAEGFRTGRVTAPAPTLAFRWYTKAAELGHPTGTNNLGCCYQFGTGVGADPDRAFALYTRAAELGDPMALINLAICHEQGIGTPVNREKAGELRRRAAAAPR